MYVVQTEKCAEVSFPLTLLSVESMFKEAWAGNWSDQSPPLPPPQPQWAYKAYLSFFQPFLTEWGGNWSSSFFAETETLWSQGACNTRFLKIVFDSAEIFDF